MSARATATRVWSKAHTTFAAAPFASVGKQGGQTVVYLECPRDDR